MNRGDQKAFYDAAKCIRFIEEPCEWLSVGDRILQADGLTITVLSITNAPPEIGLDEEYRTYTRSPAMTTLALLPLHEWDTAPPATVEWPSQQNVHRILQHRDWLAPVRTVQWRR